MNGSSAAATVVRARQPHRQPTAAAYSTPSRPAAVRLVVRSLLRPPGISGDRQHPCCHGGNERRDRARLGGSL